MELRAYYCLCIGVAVTTTNKANESCLLVVWPRIFNLKRRHGEFLSLSSNTTHATSSVGASVRSCVRTHFACINGYLLCLLKFFFYVSLVYFFFFFCERHLSGFCCPLIKPLSKWRWDGYMVRMDYVCVCVVAGRSLALSSMSNIFEFKFEKRIRLSPLSLWRSSLYLRPVCVAVASSLFSLLLWVPKRRQSNYTRPNGGNVEKRQKQQK